MARPVVKRQEIEEAALALFATKGLARTTIKDIAKRAKVAEGALYRHYKSKNDMAWRLFCREVDRFSDGLGSLLFDKDAPFALRLRRAVEFIYRYYLQHPVRFSFILLTQHGFPQKKLLDEKRNPNDLVIRFIRREIKAGSIARGDPALLAALLMGTVLQPVVMHRYGRIRKSPVRFAGEVAEACQRLLGLRKRTG